MTEQLFYLSEINIVLLKTFLFLCFAFGICFLKLKYVGKMSFRCLVLHPNKRTCMIKQYALLFLKS